MKSFRLILLILASTAALAWVLSCIRSPYIRNVNHTAVRTFSLENGNIIIGNTRSYSLPDEWTCELLPVDQLAFPYWFTLNATQRGWVFSMPLWIVGLPAAIGWAMLRKKRKPQAFPVA